MHDDSGQQQTISPSVDFFQDYGQDNQVQAFATPSVGKLILRAEELQLRIEKQFVIADEFSDDIDNDMIERMAMELETTIQKIENHPVTSLSVAKMKIAFFMKMIKIDHPDPTFVDLIKGKILGVFANYATFETSDERSSSKNTY